MVAKSDTNNGKGGHRTGKSMGASARRARSDGHEYDAVPENDDEFMKRLCYGDEADSGNERPASAIPNPWLLFLHLLIAPKLGWRRIKGAGFEMDDYARRLFYPLLALMAACRFIDKIYYSGVPLWVLLQDALALFVAGFAGFYLVNLLARMFLPTVTRIKIDSGFGRIYIMTVMGVLALAMTVSELLPWLGMMLLVLPIYSTYILVKGLRPLRVPAGELMPSAIVMTVLCLGVPTAIYYSLRALMPPA